MFTKLLNLYKQLYSIIKSKKRLMFFVFYLYIICLAIGILAPNMFIEKQNELKDTILSQALGKSWIGVSKIIFLNNIYSALATVYYSIILGLYSLVFIAVNGYILGAVSIKTYAIIGATVYFTVIPHGIFEIPAAILAFTLGISMGITQLKYLKLLFYSTEKRTVLTNYLCVFFKEFKENSLILILIIMPLLVVGSIIEGILFSFYTVLYDFVFNTEFKYLSFSLIVLYLFYGVIKLTILHKKHRNENYPLIIAFMLLLASQLWMRAYGLRVQDFFEKFSFIFTIIPLAIFLIYNHFEGKRYEEEKAKQQIKSAFSQYVSSEIIEDILKDPKKLKLGGERKKITVFFSDIRGFTTISEKLSPEELVKLLNEYLSAMTDIIMKYEGVVDKYMGDAIMAFWGAPIEKKNQEELACRACIEMKQKLMEMQKKWESENIPLINIGIGLNTGDCVVGNMGSTLRFDYTVMGDNVNLGSRLEGLNKEYGTTIIVSEYTFEKVKHKFLFRELDLVKVKGKHQPIRIYELVKEEKYVNIEDKQIVKLFSRGLEAYRRQDWVRARESFMAILEIRKDLTSEIYLERIEKLSKESLPKDWDGVNVMKTK